MKAQALIVLAVILPLVTGCATVRTLDGARSNMPLVYSGTRLDLYAMNGGCCPKDRFGALPPRYPLLDLPGSMLLDTLLLPFSLAAAAGAQLSVQGGL